VKEIINNPRRSGKRIATSMMLYDSLLKMNKGETIAVITPDVTKVFELKKIIKNDGVRGKEKYPHIVYYDKVMNDDPPEGE